MAAEGVTINRSSVRRAWDKSGRDEFWLELRTDRVTLADREAFAGFVAALNEVNTIFEDREGGETSFETIAPKGFVTFAKGVHSDAVLDEWLAVLATHFEMHGLRGELRGASQAREPSWFDRSGYEGRTLISHPPEPTAFVSWMIDLDALAADRSGTRAQWLVAPEATDRICRYLAEWAEPGGPNIQLSRSLFRFEITDPDAVAPILTDSVLFQGRARLLRHWPRHDHGATVDLAPRGETVLQIVDPDEPWPAHVDSLRAAITTLPELTNQAFIRPAPRCPISWGSSITIKQSLPHELPEVAIRSHTDLLDQYVPDAHAIQVLRDEHLAHARDLSKWHITSLGYGRHLVEAPDLTPWYSQPLPEPDVVEQARRDFGDMILTEATIQQNLPDWWDGPRPPHYPPQYHHGRAV